MSKERFHFRLGIFTIVGIIVAASGVVFFGNGRWHQETFIVETYFDQSISGLDVGAPVRHRGVNVGRVTKINFVTSKYHVPPNSTGGGKHNFNMANLILVEMSINREVVRPLDAPDGNVRESINAMIADGLRVKFSSSLLGGGGFIDADFIDESIRVPPFTVPWVPTDIYIPSQPSPAGQLIENLDRVAFEIQRAHPGELIKHVDALVQDAHRLTAGIDSTALQQRAVDLLDRVKAITASIEKITDNPHLAAILSDTAATAANARTLTDPERSELARLLAQTRVAAKQLQDILNDPSLKTALANTGPLTTDARRLTSGAAELLTNERDDLAELVRSLTAVAANIEAITSDAKDNPSRILFGEPPPRKPIPLTPEKP